MHATNYLQYKADYLARQAQSPAAALGEPEKPQGS